MTQDKDKFRADFEAWYFERCKHANPLHLNDWTFEQFKPVCMAPDGDTYKVDSARDYWQAWQAARASAPQGVPQHLNHALEKLQRFEECASDFDADGVDIGREWLDALTMLGLLERVQRSPAMWQITEAGESLLKQGQEVSVPNNAFDVIKECEAALAEELGAWDIDPPIHHVKKAHEACVAWLAAAPQPVAQKGEQ